MKDKTLHMVGNAHIDPVWLWQWQEGFHEVKATFRSALDRMHEYPDFTFVSSSAAFYEWVELSDPAMFAEIQQRIAEGRWQLVGGWWIEPDCNLPGGESFVRQGLYAQRYFRQKFGRTARIGYNPDSFGHHGMLPQILKKSGLDYYVFMRPMPHEKGLPNRLFWWEADDGSRVLAFRLPYEYCTWGADLDAHVQRCAAELRSPFTDTLCFYGVGNHGGGPTRQNLDSILRMAGDPGFPSLVQASLETWFDRIRQESAAIPVIHDDLQHHASGCYAAHSGIKRWNRRLENLLVTAEKFASIAFWTTGQPYPANFDQAWKNVLFNQFHDILAGTSLESAYEDARDLYGEAAAIAGRGLNYALQSLAWDIKIEPEDGMTPITVFNPHAWEGPVNVEMEFGRINVGDQLVDEAGHPVPYQLVQPEATAKGRHRLSFTTPLPPLGYRTFRLRPAPTQDPTAAHPTPTPAEPHSNGAHPLPFEAGGTWLESARYRLELDPETGAIQGLFDKRLGVQVFSGPAALPVVLDDRSDTWAHNVFAFNQAAGCFHAERIRVVEMGPVKAVLRAASRYGASTLVQDFTLYAGLDIIDVYASLNWNEQFKALKLRFPVNVSHMQATSEIPYGHIERFANGQEEPGHSWLDLSGLSRDNGLPYGLSLLNDGKYSFDVNVRDIGLTILRSPIYAHHVPVEPDPEGHYTFMDQGPQRFRYTLLPHAGSWESAGTVRRAAELNQPALALAGTYHPGGSLPQAASFLSIDRPSVVASVLKKAEDGEALILRCVETAQEAVTAQVCLPFWNRGFTAEFSPCEIKTFLIPRDPGEPVRETSLLEWDE